MNAPHENVSWHKSSYSTNGANCVEVGVGLLASHVVPVRDSKVSNGPILAVHAASWSSFVSAVNSGELA
ncbi:DUF397 domain-containing protein [Streptomyces sp. 8L]|uniref:DUF397 domain-containing protein n=1 Tax=Streptomyces sp. 8L TaxID=2877242 RepID=UPI001CD1DE84|nr:DUF397 domain-containing protein [Streptomyces sp. 8L]MCA1220456.1 DUF397 domain-containing protein [Streptomyces sp. 8L]